MHENNRHFSSNHSMIRRVHIAALGVALALAPAATADLACDLSQYKPADGLSAKIEGNTLALTWRGERDTDLRLGLGIDNGHPVVAEMAVRPKGGAWSTLAGNLSPEFHVTSGASTTKLASCSKPWNAQELMIRTRWSQHLRGGSLRACWAPAGSIRKLTERPVLSSLRKASQIAKLPIRSMRQ